MKQITVGESAGVTSIYWYYFLSFSLISVIFIISLSNFSYIHNFFVNRAADNTNAPAQIAAMEKSLVCI